MFAAATTVALAMLALSLALALYRLLIGPATVDRILALDTMSINVLALLVVLSIRWDTAAYLESALVLALLGFVSTVTFAKYLVRGRIID